MTECVFADAFFAKGTACVAAVYVCGGAIIDVRTSMIAADGSTDAETAGIAFARECFPDVKVFNDSTSACDVTGATWIPRSGNWPAHDAAHIAYKLMVRSGERRHQFREDQRRFLQLVHAKRIGAMGRLPKRKRRRGGRGVVLAGTSRYVRSQA